MRRKHLNHSALPGVMQAVGLALALGIGPSACAQTSGAGAAQWTEEALLHDGKRVIVTRTVERGGRHEIGQLPPYKEQSLRFTMPGSNQAVIWEDHFSQDLGMANFLPMTLDIHAGAAYLVAKPMGCLSYNKWGRPNPPYVIFKYQGKQWERISLQELPIEIKSANLIGSSPDEEAKNAGQSPVSAETITALNAGYRQPEYRSVLREAIPNAGGERCSEMIGNGKGKWLGTGWFSEKPSLEVCLNYCVDENFGAQFCPCNILFKGK